jgi:hypothetical protein
MERMIVSMDGILELPKRNRSLLLSTLLSLVNNLDDEAKKNEMQYYLACMKHEQVMHTLSSRCIPHVRMGKGDNPDYAGGLKPRSPYQSKHITSIAQSFIKQTEAFNYSIDKCFK